MKSTLSNRRRRLGQLCAGLAGGCRKGRPSKPMNFEAESLRYDDAKQLSILSGNVVPTKGTIVMARAHRDARGPEDTSTD